MTTMRIVHGGGDPTANGAVVVNGRPMRSISRDLLDALVGANDPPEIFVRAGQLVRVRADEKGRPIVDHITETLLRNRVGAVCDTVRALKDGGQTHVPPPMDIVRDVLARGTWPVPPLEAVTEIPTLRPDGTIHAAAGYDPVTHLVHVPARGLVVPEIPNEPTTGEIVDATDLLDELLHDFPFDTQADKANTVAALLTPLIRPAITGDVPLALVDAPQPGTGKGLLTDLVGLIATGRTTSKKPLPGHDEEIRKMITATLAEGATVIVLDNVEEAIQSPSLAAVLTSETWADRILGRSEIIQLPNRATWIATGNNISVAGDLARRCYRIRLDAHQPRPDTRRGFLHDPLGPWVQHHRGHLLAALLTLARAWWHAGQPPAPSAPTLGSFTPWARTIAGILEHSGIDAFLDNQTTFLATADADAVEWETFLDTWRTHAPTSITTGELAALLREHELFRNALPTRFPDDLEKTGVARRIGNILRRRAGRWHGELQIEQVGLDRNKVALWRVVGRDTPTKTNIAQALFGTDPAAPAAAGSTDPAQIPDPAADPAAETPQPHPHDTIAGSAGSTSKSYLEDEKISQGPPGKTDPAEPADPAPTDNDAS